MNKVLRKYLRLAFLLAWFCSIVGCAAPPLAPVSAEHVVSQKTQDEAIGGTYIRFVRPGDTLYSIAFAAGLDVNEVARWNGLSDGSRLQVGQRLRLTQPLNEAGAPAVTASRKINKASRLRPSAQTAKNESSSRTPRALSSKALSQKDNGGAKQEKSRPVSSSKPSSKTVAWGWPLTGARVISPFNPNKRKQGIDILGKSKQKVLAAADGEVVYVGEGIKGYGKLIILKHNSVFLSAYAHNSLVNVSEGQQVMRGQAIAVIGRRNDKLSVLHFQLRRYGKPLNPIKYLPKI